MAARITLGIPFMQMEALGREERNFWERSDLALVVDMSQCRLVKCACQDFIDSVATDLYVEADPVQAHFLGQRLEWACDMIEDAEKMSRAIMTEQRKRNPVQH